MASVKKWAETEKRIEYAKGSTAEKKGHAAERAGDHAGAAKHFREAAHHFTEAGDMIARAIAHSNADRARGKASHGNDYGELYKAAKEASQKAADAGKSGRIEYVVEHHVGGQRRVTVYPSKKAAHEAGMTIRRSGGVAFAHPSDFYKKHIDPSWNGKSSGGGGSGGDDFNRDANGRFAPK